MNTQAKFQATNPRECWICGSRDVISYRKSSLPEVSNRADLVRITDASYGTSAEIFQCKGCGFLQCSDFTSVLGLYESMDDQRYQETRKERSAQARQILGRLPNATKGKRLLDVGAGSGILVGEAIGLGLEAVGIEPSHWLQAQAAESCIPVVRGVLPSNDLTGPYDFITVIDVIEHVPDPVALMKECAALLADGGYGIVVTPDVGSWTARLLGAKWWHYRPAHIGYFNAATLTLALKNAGLRPVRIERARWVLPADYLWERIMHYLPRALRFSAPSAIAGKPVSLNLFDSFLVVFQKQ